MKRLLMAANFFVWGLVLESSLSAMALPQDESPQETDAHNQTAPLVERPDHLTGTPEWWLTAGEEIDSPRSVTLQTNACDNRLAAEAELDAAIANAANIYFSNFLDKKELEELVGAVEFLKKNAVYKGRYTVLAVREPTQGGSDVSEVNSLVKYRGYAHLKFPEDLWQTRLIRDRLVIATILSWTVISGLMVFSIFLRLNHATRGMYQGRLQIGAIVLFFAMSFLSWWVSQVLV